MRGAINAAACRKRWLLAVLVCGGASGVAAETPPALLTRSSVAPRLSALLDMPSDEKEVTVVAVIEGGSWQSAGLASAKALKRLAQRKPAFQLFPPADGSGGPGVYEGKLSGRLREKCYEYYFGLATRSLAYGFAAVNTTDERVSPVQLQRVKVEPAYLAAVARIIARETRVKVVPTIERAYRVDLDGNGKPEVILQATHPDLNDDPSDYKPEYYSLIVVLPDAPGAEPVFTGYLQGDKKSWADFEVLELDSVADVDLDGKRELLVRARHEEGWQTQIFRYDGKLTELFRSVGGEGECPGSGK